MGACAATRIGDVTSPDNGEGRPDGGALVYASGNRGKSVMADGKGGVLPRGWYRRVDGGAALYGPHPTKTAAREASREVVARQPEPAPSSSAEILGDAAPAAAAQKAAAPLGYVRSPGNVHPDSYALRVGEGGAGLFAPPGSAVIVEPIAPTKAGLAVLYRDGKPEIWDLTHNFVPGSFDAAGRSGLASKVEMVEPETGRIGRAYAHSFEKAHRIVGVSWPIEAKPAPAPLPIMPACPEGMGEHVVADASAYSLLRPGETAIYDPSKRDLQDGALCVLEWSNGHRSVLLTNQRSFANHPNAWMVDPVNRPGSTDMMKRRLARGLSGGMLFTSDGPYDPENLRSKIVGRVVGVLVPPRTDGPHEGRDESAPPAAAPQAALPIEPALAQACLAQIERVKRWDEHPGSLSEEEGEVEMDRWGVVFSRAINEPSGDLSDLAAKAVLMLDDMDRFMPVDQYKTSNYQLMRVILSEITKFALVGDRKVLATAVPSHLPPAGSPEAVEAFRAACRAVDASDIQSDAERDALKIGNSLQYWTSDVVEAAQMGNFSRIMPSGVEAAKATSPARLGELRVLTLRRELRMAEAVQASRLRELFALAYPDDQDEVADDAPDIADPVSLAIEAHRSARATLTASCNAADSVFVAQAGGDASDEAMASARAIHDAASDAEADAWDALLETRPSDAAGLLRMLRYIAGAGPMEVVGDARELGRNIVEAAEAALAAVVLDCRVEPAAASGSSVVSEEDGPFSIEGAAELDFAAYDLKHAVRDAKVWAMDLSFHGLAMHLADRLFRMNKAETIDFLRDAAERDKRNPETMFRLLHTSAETLDGWSKMLETASSRYIVAGSSLAMTGQADAPSEA